MKQVRQFIKNILIQEAKKDDSTNKLPVVIYSAVCIEDPSEIVKIDELRNKYVPANKGWKKPKDYHMTISPGTFPRALRKKGDLNQEVILVITAIGSSDNAIAFETEGYYSRNEIPHITVAFSKFGEPADSNRILSWKPIEEIQIKGVIRQVAEGNVILKENLTQTPILDKDIQQLKDEGELYYPNIQIKDGRVFTNYLKSKESYSISEFKKQLLDLKLERVSNVLKSRGIKVRNSATTTSIYLKFPGREIRISDHENRHFFGMDIRVKWNEKVGDMLNKIMATITAAAPRNFSRNLSESSGTNSAIFYHGTTDNHYDEIMNKGLNSPYLTDDYQKAEYYAEVASEEDGGDPIVFEVNIPSVENLRVDFPELDEPVTLGDEDMKNRIQKAYKTYIKKFPKSYDKKYDIITVDKHHYQVSLKTTNTVRYEGNIPSDKIKIV